MITRSEMPRPAGKKFHSLMGYVIYSFVFTLCIEILSRRSMSDAIRFLLNEPTRFACNALPMLLLLCTTFLMRKQNFGIVVISVFFGLLGVANGVIRIMRLTPLEAADFIMLPTALSIVNVYLSIFEIILLILAILLLVSALVAVYRRTSVKPRQLKKGIQAVCYVGLLTLCALSAYHARIPEDGFANLAGAYDEYGFIYSFGNSVFNQGIPEPDNYTPESMEEILEVLRDPETAIPKRTPNIIFVQLESFFDLTRLEGLKFSQVPTPVFNALKTTCASGTLRVPSLGGGTVNTEFEVLTGMNLDDFGAGEYPYKTFLKETPCESLAWNLKECGYATHAIHNHTAMFYDRYNVYPALGFDTFTSVEYMQDVSRTALGWSRDEILVDEILKTLSSTEGQDFIWTVSVQPHGAYPQEPLEGVHTPITVSGTEDEKEKYAFEYYAAQLLEVDTMLSRLVTELTKHKEEVVLVAYGDHLPAMERLENLVESGDAYETEYVIWSNFSMEAADCDLATWQLGAQVLSQVGIENGVLTKLHQRFSSHRNYEETLEMLEYDMIYGEHEVYDGVIPYEPTQMRMGISEIYLEEILYDDEMQSLTVRGYGFTPFSQIVLDDEPLETVYVSKNELRVEEIKIEDGQIIRVGQIGNGAVLSQSGGIVFQ